MKNQLLLFLFLFMSFSLTAENYDIENLTNNDGLSNSSINSINQDSNGLLWFGTWDGLDAYNGREFKVFKPDPGNANTISNNIIRDIVEEKKGIQWIATDQGINRMDVQKKTFERFFVDEVYQTISNEHSFLLAKNALDYIFAAVYKQGIYYFNTSTHKFIRLNDAKNFRIKKIFFDDNDDLWLFTEEKELFKIVFKKGKLRTPQIKDIVRFQKPNNIESVFYNSNNEIWMQTIDKKIFSYKISDGTLKDYPKELQKVGTIRAIVFMDSYQLWGTAYGLYRFDMKVKHVEPILSKVSVLSLLAGTQQIIWVGTDMQGVLQLSPPREKFHSYSSENIPLFGNCAVRTFFEGPGGTLWVGTKGNGIYTLIHKEENSKFKFKEHFTIQNGLLNNSVFTIVKGQPSEYWIGTDGRGINYFDTKLKKIYTLFVKNSLQQKVNLSSVYSILPFDKNILWVGTSGYGLYKLVIDRSSKPYSVKSYKQYVYQNNHQSSLSNNIVYSIIRDDDKHLWIATRGGGINRYNMETEKFQVLRFSSNNPGFISSDDILCLYKDKQGFLWAGTSMGLNKLIRFDKNKPLFARFTEKEGMPNNTIHGILEDKEHNMWLSTNNGIAQLVHDPTGYRIISYYKKDGLQNNEFSDGAFYKSPLLNQFYFGGISGFNMFNPLDIMHSNYMPTILLDAFYLNNVETNISEHLQTKKAGKTLVLSQKNNSFSFKFIPLDYLSGSKCEISYLLEGYQKDWIYLGTSNTIVFSNLPHGNYILKVRCSNANKIWSNKYFLLPVKVLPSWWASPIAYIIYTVLLLLLLYVINSFFKYRLSVRKDFKIKELEKQKTEEIHEAKLSFFTNIAHEFSNSLTLIYGPCEQLLSTHPSDITRKYINTIKSNSERMQNLIQQLIEFRKAETGHLKLEIEFIDIPELIRFVVDNFIDALEQKKIYFSLTFSPDIILWQTDRNSVEKIMFNLISNAVKYTPPEENIKVLVEKKDSLILIRVTNTGVGINPAFQERIFDRFEVLDRFEMQISKGFEIRNGIGLALCKNIVEVLHGNIEVESDGETYTSFIVSLPEQGKDKSVKSKEQEVLKLSAQEAEINKKVPLDEKATSIHKAEKEGLVMVIDDDREIRNLINDFLCDKFEIAEAANGLEALELIYIRMPLIIVCDIIMPKMDGIEFLKKMKGQELTRHIPIILLSTKSSVESQIEGLESGADVYLSKPFHPRHLEALIESLLHRDQAVLHYNESIYAALEQYEGKFIHKEDKELMLRITKIIHDHIDNEALSLDFIAKGTALSRMQLYRKMKEIIEQTPTEYIRSIRLKYAEKLLKTSNKTVQEIMFNCGFNNKAYFYREFEKKYHLTPKEYRNQK